MFGFLKKHPGIDWIVVFLGNPGTKYEKTRHNVGFMAADKCTARTGAEIKKAKFKALTGQVSIGDSKVLLMKPQTFMNLSGDAVAEAARFYKVAPSRVIVISDDISLAVGKLRIRGKGSAGGHNGLKSIIARLGTDEFPRIKVGVGAPSGGGQEQIDWVLGRFQGEDAKIMDAAVENAWLAAETYILEGMERAMNKYSKK